MGDTVGEAFEAVGEAVGNAVQDAALGIMEKAGHITEWGRNVLDVKLGTMDRVDNFTEEAKGWRPALDDIESGTGAQSDCLNTDRAAKQVLWGGHACQP
jgi:hypothetical protein